MLFITAYAFAQRNTGTNVVFEQTGFCLFYWNAGTIANASSMVILLQDGVAERVIHNIYTLTWKHNMNYAVLTLNWEASLCYWFYSLIFQTMSPTWTSLATITGNISQTNISLILLVLWYVMYEWYCQGYWIWLFVIWTCICYPAKHTRMFPENRALNQLNNKASNLYRKQNNADDAFDGNSSTKFTASALPVIPNHSR